MDEIAAQTVTPGKLTYFFKIALESSMLLNTKYILKNVRNSNIKK